MVRARAGYFRRLPTSPRARTTRTFDTTRESIRWTHAVTTHSFHTSRTHPDFAPRSLSLCYACAATSEYAPSHPGWFAIDNALGRLHGGAFCSHRVCLRECVASPRRSSSRSAGAAAACRPPGSRAILKATCPRGRLPAGAASSFGHAIDLSRKRECRVVVVGCARCAMPCAAALVVRAHVT